MFYLCNIISAQISPGDLTRSHAYLEGMINCTQCHDLGNKVSSQKCLNCHDIIASLINDNRGYHASKGVMNKECVDCHSEHHGRKFDMVRFDQDKFDHNLTGYKLEGQHKILDCKECHQSDNIKDNEIRNRKNTFLGLGKDCLSCHEDYHQETLNNDCIKCHNFEAFQPAPKFDHHETDFALKGMHLEVSCVECHPKSSTNGKQFQQFSDINFSDCKSCHDDPHNNQLPGKCAQCHIEDSFGALSSYKKFNHSLTSFTLRGKHQSTSCYECHTKSGEPLKVFQDNLGIGINDCNKCHEDQHEGRFGQDCAKCHTEESFLTLKSMDFFDHSVTDFTLEGLHLNVECKSCHIDNYSDPIAFEQCKNCHEDYHNGEFEDTNPTSDCNNCHSVNNPFTSTTYGLDEHNQGNFPLEGAHIATPCFACHVSEDRWGFTDVGNDCIHCHEDIHQDYISEKYYPNQNCSTCHNPNSWQEVSFDHTSTEWDLTGAHISISCDKCHIEYDEGGKMAIQAFKGLKTNCYDCHENIHGEQFEENGLTDCLRCHITENWQPTNFDHNSTNFPLEGKHAELDCKACHKEEKVIDGNNIINYKIESFECIDCHS